MTRATTNRTPRSDTPGRARVALLRVALLRAVLPVVTGFAMAVALSPAVAGAAPAPVRAAACGGSSGVTVTIDFRSLGGGVQSACAPGSPSSGFDALSQAGVGYRTVRGGGFICTISGVPASNCVNIPPASAYWSYWYKPAGGSWTYSSLGAGSRTPPQGSAEGWSYYSSSCDGPSALPPGANPRPSCPPPPTNPPPATTAAPPRPTQPPATSPTPGATPGANRPAGGSANGGGSATPSPSGNGDGNGAGQPSGSDAAGAAVDGTTTTPKGDTTGSSQTGTSDPEAAGAGADGPSETGDTTADTSPDGSALDEQTISAREGTRDLAGGASDSGSPLPVLIGLLLVAGVAGLGVTAARRRRAPG